ncbi:MAG TPA: hypothetical protein VLJ68_09735 [Chitinophagaceae bacterium]|nr:hypothetical protein [Chitinophagaceae bacterium]
MFSFIRKNKLVFDVLATLVFAAVSVFKWYDYYGSDGKKMDLIGGIVFGLMAIVKLDDVIAHYRPKKKLPDEQANRKQ